jgi:preprotein translocase subunit SecA
VFATRAAKQRALVVEIAAVHATGRPVLVGTWSVEESEQLATALAARGLGCHVLNAKNDAREAAIVAEAGAVGALTMATNMAGRGIDIRLGGKDELRSDEVVARLRERVLDGELPFAETRFAGAIGRERAGERMRQLQLAALDRGWSEQLEQTQDVQEGIQLVVLGGEQPLDQFRRRAMDAFDAMLERVAQRVHQVLGQWTRPDAELDLVRAGIERPASTWTYLLNDRIFGDYRDQLLGNLGFGAAAAFTGPLLLMLGVAERLRSRRAKR